MRSLISSFWRSKNYERITLCNHAASESYYGHTKLIIWSSRLDVGQCFIYLIAQKIKWEVDKMHVQSCFWHKEMSFLVQVRIASYRHKKRCTSFYALRNKKSILCGLNGREPDMLDTRYVQIKKYTKANMRW